MFNLILFFFISILTILLVKQISIRLKLLDLPSSRKNHDEATPNTGGIALNFLFIYAAWTYFFFENLNVTIFYAIFITLIGFLDDKYNLNPGTKITVLTLIIYYFVNENSIYIEYLSNNFYFLNNLNLGEAKVFFTVACILLLMNALNYSDGIDGLAASIFLFSLINLAFVQYINFKYFNFELLILSIPLIIFICFNIFPIFKSKFFLGDNGSLLLGFILSIICILMVFDLDKKLEPEAIIWCLALIVFEFLSTNLSRIIKKKRVFKPGKDHLHFLIQKKTGSNFLTLFLLVLINQLLFIFGVFINIFYIKYSILIFILVFFGYFILREFLFRNEI